MVDPVTYKVFTDNTHIVTLKNTGNVFAYDTIERLNIKAKMWRDLLNDQEFGRKDIITLQDPQNIQSRNLSSFKYLQEGISTLTEAQERERNASINASALGNAASIINSSESLSSRPPSKPQIGKYLHEKPSSPAPSRSLTKSSSMFTSNTTTRPAHTSKPTPYNAALHTTGLAAASLTSTGLTPHTTSTLALLTDEAYMLKPRRVKSPGYATITTNHGPLTLELLPEHAPKAVWNFIQLAKKGYYNAVTFHRSIRNFMLQGGDPTGTGRGGSSIWNKPFEDEFNGPLTHNARGIVSMANKGKNTNTSQFFILYRPAPHLDRKHTIFGRVVGEASMEVLSKIENVEVDEEKRPVEDVLMKEVSVVVDPFEEFLKNRREGEERERREEEVRRQGGKEEDRVTWSGKRVRGLSGVEREESAPEVGKYIDANGDGAPKGEVLEEWEAEQPVKKKVKAGGGGFGNFDSW